MKTDTKNPGSITISKRLPVVFFITMLLVFCAATTGILREARADDPLPAGVLYIGGQDIVTATDQTVSGGQGTARLSYNDTGNPVLSLENFTYEGVGYTVPSNAADESHNAVIYYSGEKNLTIAVNGTNLLKQTGANYSYGICIRTNNTVNLTFNGDGKLKVQNSETGSNSGSGIYTSNASLLIDGCLIEAISGQSTHDSRGIYCYGDILIKSGAIIAKAGQSLNNKSHGIETKSLTMTGGTVNAEGNTNGIKTIENGIISIALCDANMIATGSNGALSAEVKNQVPGVAWENTEGTGEQTSIPVSDSGQSISESFKKVHFQKERIVFTVTFKVINGAWNNKTTSDVIVELSRMIDEDKLLSLSDENIPAVGNEPYEGCAEGTWDVTPVTEMVISESKTFTYTYSGTPVPTILKAPEAKQLFYTGSEQELVTAGEAENGTMLYALGDKSGATKEFAALIPAGKDAGTYTVWYKVKGDAHHRDTDPLSLTSSIVKQAITVSGITAKDKPYDGTTTAALDFSNAVLTGKAEGDTLTVTATGTFADAEVGQDKTVTISNLALGDTGGNNYELASEGQQTTATASIKANELHIVAKDYSGVYDGQAHGISVTTEEKDVMITYAETIDGAYSTNILAYTDVGIYTVYYRAEKKGSMTVTGAQTVTITKADSAVVIAPAAVPVLVYNGTAQTLIIAGKAAGGTMLYALGTDAATMPTAGWNMEIPTGTDAGSYYIWYYIQADKNHTDFEPACITAVIQYGTLTTRVVCMEGAPAVISTNLAEVAQSLLNEGELEKGVQVWLEIARITADDVEAANRNALKAKSTILDALPGEWLDIRLYKQVGSAEKELIHKINQPLSLSVQIPAKLNNSGRTFWLLQGHEGNATEIATTTGDTLDGKTDRFSTYLIAYKDPGPTPTIVPTPTTTPAPSPKIIPQTRDSGNPMLWICLMVLGLVWIVCLAGIRHIKRRG